MSEGYNFDPDSGEPIIHHTEQAHDESVQQAAVPSTSSAQQAAEQQTSGVQQAAAGAQQEYEWVKDANGIYHSVPKQSHVTTENTSNGAEQQAAEQMASGVQQAAAGAQQEYEWVKDANGIYHSVPKQPHATTENAANGTAQQTYQYRTQPFQTQAQPKQKKKSSGTGRKYLLTIGLAVVFGVVASAVFTGMNLIQNQLMGSATAQQETVDGNDSDTQIAQMEKAIPSTQATATASGTVASVAENAMPSMVAITNISVQEVRSMFGYGSQEYESESSGSGIIVGQNDTELLIATNNHVVNGASSITVCFIDDEVVEGQIKGTDTDNDLAVIAVNLSDIKDSTKKEIKTITLGDSDSLVVGEQVVAIGNALGYGQSVSGGYVSALDREITVDNVTAKLIQTDAAINPGNSGGALLDINGNLIGINAIKYSASEVEGMGYAIPISSAEPILNELMSKTTRVKVSGDKASYIGITCKNIAAEYAEGYDAPTGVYVDSVSEGGPADQAGLEKGDIITKMDDTTVTSYEELVNELSYHEAGETVTFTISRVNDGEYREQEIKVTLGSQADKKQ